VKVPALLAALALAWLVPGPAAPAAFDLRAEEALVVDHETGATLLAKNADVAVPPASMLKLMTLNMVFEALKEGRLSLEDRFPVSEKAWRMGGSKMFLRAGERPTVEQLIRGVVVLSGNDACVVLAEGLAGTEEAFAERMTQRARELGMEDSAFGNSTGWPDENTRMSPRDLVFLAGRIIREFPEYYTYFAETTYSWDGIEQRNRNPLLYADVGADGLKTGHTEEAGYGLVGSAVRDGRRIVFMVGGYEDRGARATEAERLVEWAFREFSNETLFRAGEPLGEAEVWLGDAARVGLTLAEDLVATVPFGERASVRARIRWEGPLEAPIRAGEAVAEMDVEAPGLAPVTVPVVAAEDVAEGGWMVRLGAAGRLLVRDLAGAAD
jgi:D-alanyl-D-alanine carboxypeptidase (penicillin-binding protein 5/6)